RVRLAIVRRNEQAIQVAILLGRGPEIIYIARRPAETAMGGGVNATERDERIAAVVGRFALDDARAATDQAQQPEREKYGRSGRHGAILCADQSVTGGSPRWWFAVRPTIVRAAAGSRKEEEMKVDKARVALEVGGELVETDEAFDLGVAPHRSD